MGSVTENNLLTETEIGWSRRAGFRVSFGHGELAVVSVEMYSKQVRICFWNLVKVQEYKQA